MVKLGARPRLKSGGEGVVSMKVALWCCGRWQRGEIARMKLGNAKD